jgi:hypothetical protein
VVQVIELLPSKCEAVSSNSGTEKKNTEILMHSLKQVRAFYLDYFDSLVKIL